MARDTSGRHWAKYVCAMTLATWSRNSRFYCPRPALSSHQSTSKQLLSYTGYSGQFCQSVGRPAKDEVDIRLSVVSLFAPSCPFAITRLVVAVVIDALKCVKTFTERACPHVIKKGFERISPSLTDCDATRPVVLEGRIRWVVATREHVLPCGVRRGLPAFPSMTVRPHANLTRPLSNAMVA